MPKRVQDIIPNNKRTIRDIPVHDKAPETHTHTKEKEFTIKIHKPAKDKVVGSLISYESPKKETKKRKGGTNTKMMMIFFGSIVTIVIIGYFASQFYAVAKFDIIPISYPAEIKATIISQATPSTDTVLYSITNLSETASTTVSSTNGEYQESRSTGKVTIFNNYSKSTQRLIAGTRLSTSDGLIYKLSNSITVPGMTSKGPSQISASIIAEKAGQDYNINKTKDETLYLVGFKGTPKYTGFYGKLSTDTTGGFAGTKKNISKEIIASTTKYLEQQLLSSLSVKIHDKITDDKILFDQGILFSTSSIAISDVDTNTSRVTLTGTVNAITFDKKSLFSKLVGDKIINKFDKYSFDVNNIENLHVAFTNLKDFSAIKKSTLLSNFEGSITIVARIPIEEIRSKLIGLPLSGTYDIIRSYSDIIDNNSRGEVMPPWSKVPSRIDNIEVKVEKVK